MNRKRRFTWVAMIFIALILIALSVYPIIIQNTIQGYFQQAEEASIFENIHTTYGATNTRRSDTVSYEILVRDNLQPRFVFWSKAVSGVLQLSIIDAEGKIVYEQNGRNASILEDIPLAAGHYTVRLYFNNYTGSYRFGFSNVSFAVDLPAEQYLMVNAEPEAGFYWDYLLYTPEEISSSYLLVIPNNTGFEESDMAFHQAAAGNLIRSMSSLADELGTPLLVPIFPRPDGELSEYYTHNLDRSALLMEVDGYQRLDLQLLSMLDDARSRLNENDIETDERILLWGFSASGTFIDRFSLLHPERVKAVAAGGCTHSLPFAEYADENLPYPIGAYDYQTITGHTFDEQTFSSIPRFLYKGDQDSGGTQTVDGITYPANQYFDLFIRADLDERVDTLPVPVVNEFNMTYPQEEAIKYRIYNGAVFVEEFKAVRDIYADAGLANTQFKLYPGVGHEITDEMRADVLAFFTDVIE